MEYLMAFGVCIALTALSVLLIKLIIDADSIILGILVCGFLLFVTLLI